MRTLIAALWIATIASTAWDAATRTIEVAGPETPVWFGVVGVLLPLLFIPFFAYRANKPLFHAEFLARWIDARAGDGAFERFLRGLRPFLLMSANTLVIGLVLLARSLAGDGGRETLMAAAFFVSCGVACVLAHAVQTRRHARLA